ncbi:LysR family transcriptional regulator [Roseobacter sp. N2S]|uniref:LysR family transcriptional regulator n=1 Tax=Roseobacter sp. N2S TaxID=2663844 RepID=UPI00285ECB97|nr:LysR family transcriptional regulator [Roseobacter sp. N2S]MDR6265741.1 DNA-binding transcriptional LysR family regulator [Roseobacter sp. N2S]
MTISLFKTLIAISEHGSFSAAAEKIFVTHAAVGQQMKRLEDSLNVTLFDRSAKTPRLNQLGKALVPKAKAVVAEYETILDDLTGDPRMIGELVLGAVPSTIRGLIPKSIKRLMELYPDLHIRVVPELSPNLLEQVERGTLDAAVLSEPTRLSRNLNWMPFVEEELVLLTAPEVTENDPFEILATKPYIRHTRQASVGMLAEEWLSNNKVTVHDAMEMGSLENLSSMVAHNLGVSVGPNICVPDPIFEGLRKIPLGPTTTARTLGILTRSDCSKIQLVHRLFEQICSTVEDHHPGRVL